MRVINRDVVGTFIFSSDNKILLGQSIKGGAYEGSWCVPGGGIEPGETALQAAIRETKEEVGVDISSFDIQLDNYPSFGETEKNLRDTGERVIVKMKFLNYIVTANKKAADIPASGTDDFASAVWHNVTDLPNLTISPAMEELLLRLGYM